MVAFRPLDLLIVQALVIDAVLNNLPSQGVCVCEFTYAYV